MRRLVVVEIHFDDAEWVQINSALIDAHTIHNLDQIEIRRAAQHGRELLCGGEVTRAQRTAYRRGVDVFLQGAVVVIQKDAARGAGRSQANPLLVGQIGYVINVEWIVRLRGKVHDRPSRIE